MPRIISIISASLDSFFEVYNMNFYLPIEAMLFYLDRLEKVNTKLGKNSQEKF